ncbi:MAG: M3 family metallopeptidase [Bacteroidales bacterium]
MRKLIIVSLLAGIFLAGCNQKTEMKNPFLADYNTPFNVPPFHLIQEDHYLPAFKEAMLQEKADIDAILNNQESPDFNNTIVAFDNSGELMRKVSGVFYRITGANTNPNLQAIARELTPLLSAHSNSIRLNEQLFEKIKAVYDKRHDLNLDVEQMRLVEKIYDDFARNGAALPPEQRDKLKQINERLSLVSLQLGENLLAETNNFKLVIDNTDDLAGLPEEVISAAADEAKRNNMEGKWVFTLQKPSWIPFLQYSERRELREKLYRGYFMRGDNDNENDNKALFAELLKLRDERSKMLGFENYAAFSISDNMARTPENVYDFLHKVWGPALKIAKQERDEMQKIIDREGGNFKLASWDWWYYAEKVRKEKFDLNDDELKPYFTKDNVRNGVFNLCERLYGLTFKQHHDIPVYHEEVEVYEIFDKDGSHLGLLYMDNHPRPGKRAGAWCGTFRNGSYENGKKVYPIVTIVTNFARPVGDKPAMWTWDEVTTYFHEFGHGLHNLFADGHYRRTSRDVPRDFVELPSQVLENWAGEPEILKTYALHYETGEPIPDELINKLNKSSHFNQGFATSEYIAAAILDMDYHTMDVSGDLDIRALENASMKKLGLIDEIIPRYRTTYFSHIFSGGYAAGYYVYLWAGVLDADAFEAFKESGDVFNPELASLFRKHILAENSLGEGMEQYVKFRGKEPSIDPLLRQRGLKQ